MGGEGPNWNSNPEQNQEQTHEEHQNRGAGVLSEISFADAKREGEVPEGVRDEKDYREYLAEQEAKNKEYEKFDNEIFEEIMSIKDPDDRDLVTAILPSFYDWRLDYDGSRGKTDVARRVAMKTIVNYYKNGDKSTSLKDTMIELAREFWHNSGHPTEDDITTGSIMASLFMHPHAKFDTLANGQKVEKMDLTEAKYVEKQGARGIYSFMDAGTNYDMAVFAVTKGNSLDDETKVVLTVANDIAKQINETDDAKKHTKGYNEIGTLGNAYQLCWPDSIDEYLLKEQEEQVAKVVKSANNAINQDDYNEETSLPILDSGLADLLYTKELRDKIEDYTYAYERYKAGLKLGKSILAGEDWHQIDGIYYERIS